MSGKTHIKEDVLPKSGKIAVLTDVKSLRPGSLKFESSIPRRITTVTSVKKTIRNEPVIVAWVGYCYSCGARHAVLVNGNPLAYEIATIGIHGHKCPGTKKTGSRK